MRTNSLAPSFVQGVAVLAAVSLAACSSTGGETERTVPVDPMCTILLNVFAINPESDVALVAERTDPAVSHGFTRF
jgi:hypothetical protein